jgi:hypothetical protein
VRFRFQRDKADHGVDGDGEGERKRKVNPREAFQIGASARLVGILTRQSRRVDPRRLLSPTTCSLSTIISLRLALPVLFLS